MLSEMHPTFGLLMQISASSMLWCLIAASVGLAVDSPEKAAAALLTAVLIVTAVADEAFGGVEAVFGLQ